MSASSSQVSQENQKVHVSRERRGGREGMLATAAGKIQEFFIPAIIESTPSAPFSAPSPRPLQLPKSDGSPSPHSFLLGSVSWDGLEPTV